MQTAMAELPLALFTACALIGSGSFVMQAVIFSLVGAPQAEKRRLDMLSFIPLIVVVVGFCAAFAHLTAPLNAPWALTGVGRSPLSNEIVVGSVFLVLALVYCILTSLGKLSAVSRKAFAIVLGVGGAAFALFTGAAYFMNTIISWSTPYTFAEALGFALFAGGILFVAIDNAMGERSLVVSKGVRMTMIAIVLVGAIIGFGALALHFVEVSGFETASLSGSFLADGALVFLVVAIACGIVSAVLVGTALVRHPASWLTAAALVLAVVAVLAARFVFYALQMSIAL